MLVLIPHRQISTEIVHEVSVLSCLTDHVHFVKNKKGVGKMLSINVYHAETRQINTASFNIFSKRQHENYWDISWR